jgi:hypothetical protein
VEKCLLEKLVVLDDTRRNVTGSTTNPIRTALVSNTGRHSKRPVSNRPSHDMATHQTLRFITVFTSACNWSVSTAILNQHKPRNLIIRPLLILASNLRLNLQCCFGPPLKFLNISPIRPMSRPSPIDIKGDTLP